MYHFGSAAAQPDVFHGSAMSSSGHFIKELVTPKTILNAAHSFLENGDQVDLSKTVLTETVKDFLKKNDIVYDSDVARTVENAIADALEQHLEHSDSLAPEFSLQHDHSPMLRYGENPLSSQNILTLIDKFHHDRDPQPLSTLVLTSVAQDNFHSAVNDELLLHQVRSSTARALKENLTRIRPIESQSIEQLTIMPNDPARLQARQRSSFLFRSFASSKPASPPPLRPELQRESYGAPSIQDAFVILVARAAAHPDATERASSYNLLLEKAPREGDEALAAFLALRKAAHRAVDSQDCNDILTELKQHLPSSLQHHPMFRHIHEFTRYLSKRASTPLHRAGEVHYWECRNTPYTQFLQSKMDEGKSYVRNDPWYRDLFSSSPS